MAKKLTAKNLIENGYFCEELPPPFTSRILSSKLRKAFSLAEALTPAEKKKLYETDFVRFSIPRVGINRRLNGIPNPYHQIKLSQEIATYWKQISGLYRDSPMSASVPEIDTERKRAVIQLSKYEKFKEKCIEAAYASHFELKVDISKYFQSIYTHSIAWAIHSKAVAKRRRRDNSLYGNKLDEAIRYGQSGQTKGIPIGTDTSRIIAEIIGCSIDKSLLDLIAKDSIDMTGFRFVDDYHLFFESQADAEIAMKHLQYLLSDYGLSINEEKTSINKAPFSFENDWNHQLNNFRIRTAKDYQRIDLRNYAKVLIDLSNKHPGDSIIKYGIKRLRKVKIHEVNWPLYESIFFSLSIAEGGVLPDLLGMLLQNKFFINRKKLERFLLSMIKRNVYRGNHFEVAWSLWIAKTFGIKLPLAIAQSVANSRDVISIIILLDLKENGQVSRKLNLSEARLEFTEEGFRSDYWLLVYEASHKGWIRSMALNSSPWFKQMSQYGVSFYDETRQVETLPSNVVETPVARRLTKSQETALFMEALGGGGKYS